MKIEIIEVLVTSPDGEAALRIFMRADPRSVIDLSRTSYEVVLKASTSCEARRISPNGVEHPGKAIRRLIMEPNGLSVAKLAEALGMHETSIYHVLSGRRPISPSLDHKLAKVFKSKPGEWMAIQKAYLAATSG